MVCCPFHSEKTPSFKINPENTGHCFGCGRHASALDVFMELEDVSEVRAAALQMAEQYNIKIDEPEPTQSLTLELFARDKKFNIEFLKSIGIQESSDYAIEPQTRMNGLLIPYYLMDGSPARPRFRYGKKASHGI